MFHNLTIYHPYNIMRQTVAFYKIIILICFLLLSSGCASVSVLTGFSKISQIDGSINDSDDSTGQKKSYSSTGSFRDETDGISTASSEIHSYKHLEGSVYIEFVPNSIGPFTGTPAGVSSQKVRSTFEVSKKTRVKYKFQPKILVDISGTASWAEVEILIWVLDGTHTTATAVPGSIYTVKYLYIEDPNDNKQLIYTMDNSDGKHKDDTILDNDGLIDKEHKPRFFKLNDGKYIVQFEMNIKAGGDTNLILINSECRFDLVSL